MRHPPVQAAAPGAETGALDVTAAVKWENEAKDSKDPIAKKNCIVCGWLILDKSDQGHEHRKARLVEHGSGSHPQAGCPGMRACGAGFAKHPGRYLRFERLALWILYRRPNRRVHAPTFEDGDQLVGMISKYFRAWWPTVPTLHSIAPGPANDAAFRQEVARLAAAL